MKELIFQNNKILGNVCTLGIGGPARYFVEVYTAQQALEALHFAHEKNLTFHILGKGSNTLFDDRGFTGVVICNKIDFCEEKSPGTFYVGAGYSFSLLGAQTARNGWTGLEFASGIPASVGGAIFMNAGANGNETADVLDSVEVLTHAGELKTLPKENLLFSYRTSIFQKDPAIIIGATFKLASQLQARQRQLEIIDYRKKTQPYSEKSAGCVFRNPAGYSAGALIEQAGLKGMSIGGAKVSDKHANFLINANHGSCSDMHALIRAVQHKVKEFAGLDLECEVRYIPFEKE